MDYIYTIIIPHKNIPDLLIRCLNSIPEREDTQIIIIDDNSDTSIVDFDNFPGKNRPNTKVIITKEGKGAGYARNIGLDNIEDTKWIIFADSDDFFSDNLDNKMELYSNTDADIIFFAMDSVYSETLEPSSRKDFRNRKFFKAIAEKDLDILRYKMHGPTTKFISYNLIKKNKLRFDEIKAAEDAIFMSKIGYYAKMIMTDTDVLYVVTERAGSSTTVYSYETIRCRFDVSMRINKFLISVGKTEYRNNLLLHIYSFLKLNIFIGLKYLLIYCLHTPIKFIYKDIIAGLKYKYN